MKLTNEAGSAPIPSLTVLICCYSGEKYFEETFHSVVTQIGVDFKIVIHDNGCAPNYRKRIERAAARAGCRVIRSEVNRYGEGVRFDVLQHLDTEYVATLHDDDVIQPGRLVSDLQAIVEGDLDYLFSDRFYIDAQGARFEPNTDEVNALEFSPGDFPYVFVAELFFRGLRFHYSTLVMRTSVAQRVVYGDPFLPRIADCLFVMRLLLDRTLRGKAMSYKSTAIRVHGANDMLYSKFGPTQRERELYLLTQSELFIFREIIDRAEFDQLASILAIFPGIEIVPGEDRPTLLVRAALQLRLWHRAKRLMAAHCIHEAFRLAPRQTVMAVRKLSDYDANTLMMEIYASYADEEINQAMVLSETANESAVELWRIRSSLPWKLSAPLRALERFAASKGRLPASTPRPPPSVYKMGTLVRLSEAESDVYVRSGFSNREHWGRWTEGKSAIIEFRLPEKPTDAILELWTAMVFEPSMAGHDVGVKVNSGPVVWHTPVVKEPILVEVPVRRLPRSGIVCIEIVIPSPRTPEMPPFNEVRELGVGFESFAMSPARR